MAPSKKSMDLEKLRLELQKAIDQREAWLHVCMRSHTEENFNDAKRLYEYWDLVVNQLKGLIEHEHNRSLQP